MKQSFTIMIWYMKLKLSYWVLRRRDKKDIKEKRKNFKGKMLYKKLILAPLKSKAITSMPKVISMNFNKIKILYISLTHKISQIS